MGRIAGAQTEIENAIASLNAVGETIPTELRGQLGALIALRQDVAIASPRDVAGIARAVGSLVASATSLAQQAQGDAAQKATGSLTIAAGASQRAVQSSMDYTHSLSLRFSSEEDERAYREREAERDTYIKQQQAKGTPEGQLNAAGAAIGQMADAKGHGANGPEFDKHWNDLVSTTERLRAEEKAQGHSTEKFDKRLRDDLRLQMKAKGYSDAQIDTQFATNPDPIQAAKAFMKDGSDVDALKTAVQADVRKIGVIEAALPAQAQADAKDMIAKLRAGGVVDGDPSPANAPHHGIAVAVATVDTGVRAV
jgi:hypothetical protein